MLVLFSWIVYALSFVIIVQVVDREAVSQLEWQIKDEAGSAGELSLYYAALCLLYCGKHDKSREYVEKLLQNNGSSCGGLTLKGWLELASGKNKSAAQTFKAALAQVRTDINYKKNWFDWFSVDKYILMIVICISG